MTITPAVTEIKKLKAQILELKAKLKKFKYIPREDQKIPFNTGKNKKPLYKGLNHKSVDKKNLKCYKCDKKGYFKSEC